MMSTTEVMLEFVRAAVFDRVPIIPEGYEIDWDKLQEISSEQGVLAWVWDGICKLPKEEQPPRIVRINFGMSAQEIWDRYDYQKEILRDILNVCGQNNMRLLLFKGIAVSNLYPKPCSRPSGDIDFYLFQDYEKGNDLFAKENVTRTPKRTGFDYKGVHIENHCKFLNEYSLLQKKAVQYLLNESSKSVLSEDGYYKMEPYSDIVYQVMHIVAHIDDASAVIPIRSLFDIGLTLRAYDNKVTPDELKKILIELNILDVFCLILELVSWTVGESFPHFQYKEIDNKDLLAAQKLILGRDANFVPLINRPFFERIKYYKDQFQLLNRLYKYLPHNKIYYVLSYIKELFSISLRRMLHIPNDITYAQAFRQKIVK